MSIALNPFYEGKETREVKWEIFHVTFQSVLSMTKLIRKWRVFPASRMGASLPSNTCSCAGEPGPGSTGPTQQQHSSNSLKGAHSSREQEPGRAGLRFLFAPTVRCSEQKGRLLLTNFFWWHEESKEDDDPTSKLHRRCHQKGILEKRGEREVLPHPSGGFAQAHPLEAPVGKLGDRAGGTVRLGRKWALSARPTPGTEPCHMCFPTCPAHEAPRAQLKSQRHWVALQLWNEDWLPNPHSLPHRASHKRQYLPPKTFCPVEGIKQYTKQ